VIEIFTRDMAHGGEAVARDDQGKVYFVAGALPGEHVLVEVVSDKGSWARARLEEIVESSPHRIDPPCRHFAACGGCQWQFADYRAQLRWKEETVGGQLRHLGRIPDPEVRRIVTPGDPYGYRNRMDFKVVDGSPALTRARSRELVPLDECLLLAHPLGNLFDRLGDLSGATSVTLRGGLRTGDLMAVIEGKMPPQAAKWDASVVHRRRDGFKVISGEPHIHETVAGVRFRISPDAFFQVNTAGADSLVRLVEQALELQPTDVLLDAYAGGGLFTCTVGARAGRVIAIESDSAALADLRHNTAAMELPARIVPGRVEEVAPDLGEYWTATVVDPPRTGLGRSGIAAITSAAPRAIAYVSCDPASLGRDANLLAESGYEFVWARPVDLFPQTFHVETVALFRLPPPAIA
jgi:23S rRNA (uracil1939-C5)-methyltransferase